MRFKINGNIEDTIREVALKIESNGGDFIGDVQSGKFEVKGVSGKYEIEGSVCTLDITDKPWLVSENYIEEKILEYFS